MEQSPRRPGISLSRYAVLAVMLTAVAMIMALTIPPLAQAQVKRDTLRQYYWNAAATPTTGASAPPTAAKAFHTLRFAPGQPVTYRFRVQRGRSYVVVIGVCENKWTEPNQRVVTYAAEGAAFKTVDTFNYGGKDHPFVLKFSAQDKDRNGRLDVTASPAPQAGDRNPIINAIWIFPAADPTSITDAALIAGKDLPGAIYSVDCGSDANATAPKPRRFTSGKPRPQLAYRWNPDAKGVARAAPPEEAIEAFSTLRFIGGRALTYSFRVKPGARHLVVVGVCENHWSAAGQRVDIYTVEGAEQRTVDTAVHAGKDVPFVLKFRGADSDGDGWLTVSSEPHKNAKDKNAIINAIWLFHDADPASIKADALITDANAPEPLYFVDCGEESSTPVPGPVVIELRDLNPIFATAARLAKRGLNVSAEQRALIQLEAEAETIANVEQAIAFNEKVSKTNRALFANHPAFNFDKLLFIKRRRMRPSHVYTTSCEGFSPGGGLFMLSPPRPDGELRCLLNSPRGQIMDFDISFDAKEVIFSWKKDGTDSYHIYRMNIDGSGLRQITDGPWHDYNACWLPDGGVAFISTRCGRFVLCFPTPIGVLHRMDADGGSVRKLSANYVNDFTPSVMPDGRILFSRWEYVDRPAIPIQSLWTICPDGTGERVCFGNRTLVPGSFLEARAIPGSRKVMSTLAPHNGHIEGAVGVIDNMVGLNDQPAFTNVTPEVPLSMNGIPGVYATPYPLADDLYLVARNEQVRGRERFSLYIADTGGNRELIYRDRRYGSFYPLPLVQRRRPPVIHERVSDEAKLTADHGQGTFFLVDVYRGLGAKVRRGSIKALRVVEEVAKPVRIYPSGFSVQRPIMSRGGAYGAKRVLGTVPVEADGSAYFRAPALTPIYFQAIDERGLEAQRMRTFTQLMPGETRGCTGCHESRHSAGFNRTPAALQRPPSGIEQPSWGDRTFDYISIVQPVLDEHCVECHGGVEPAGKIDLSADRTQYFCMSYDSLVMGGYVKFIGTSNGMERNILMIDPYTWGSSQSKLAELILGGHPDKDGKARVALDADSRARILTWIDLNVPYYGTYEIADDIVAGGRDIIPKGLVAALNEIKARRCAGCHKGKVPGDRLIRVTHPELNDCLIAPLAKAAGGRGACKPEVFLNKDDPDYRAILQLFQPAGERLSKLPRMDLPNAKPTKLDRSRT